MIMVSDKEKKCVSPPAEVSMNGATGVSFGYISVNILYTI